MAYYLVLCKAGHVGRNYYMPIWFPVEAEEETPATGFAGERNTEEQNLRVGCLPSFQGLEQTSPAKYFEGRLERA